jgi:pimeloyl-ACP methyl ester carboxylesterase
VPVLYLRATEDRLVPRRCADTIAAAIPQTHIVDVEPPHFLLQAAPTATAAAVRAFIETLPQTAAKQAIPS